MKLVRFALVALSLLGGVALKAATASEPAEPENAQRRFNGIPVYQIYDDKDIENASRGNFIASSPNNTLFFSNENGINTFDGTSWKQILATDATRDKIRALFWIDHEVFASSYGSVGRLVFDAAKGVAYQPINTEPISKDASEFYPQILGNESHIFFVGMRSVVIYDRQANQLSAHNFNTWVKSAFLLQDTLYVSTDKDGLWKRTDGEFQKLPAFAKFVEERNISYLDVSPNGQIAFATENGELYRIQNERPVPAFPRFRLGSRGDLADIAFVDDERLALAVVGLGVVVLDHEGNTEAVVDKSFDYRWAAARALHVDRQGTLWTLFNSSVGKVILESPVTLIDERLRPSLNYPSAHFYDGDVYLYTTGRLFRSKHTLDGQLSGFVNALPGSSLSVSLALSTSDGLYVHADDTTYLYRDGNLTPLGSYGRLDRLTAFPDDPNLLLGVSPNRIRLLRRIGMRLELVSEIEHTAGLVNKIACDANRVFWLEIGLGQLGKVWIDHGKLQFRLYTAKDGLPPDWIAVWKNGDEMRFTERSGVFRYEPETDRFQRIDDWEPYFPRRVAPLHRVATDPKGNVWASWGHGNYILWKQPDGSFLKDEISLAQLGELYMNQFAFMENGDALLLSATEMFHLDGSRIHPRSVESTPLPYIAEISNLEGSQSFYLNNGANGDLPFLQLQSDQDSLSVRLSSPYSSTIAQPSYQYYLEGLSNDWSKWSYANDLIFTNLDKGDYTLRVRAQLGPTLSSPEIRMRFRIAPSVYQTPFAIVAYFLLIGGVVIGGYHYFSRNLKSANEKLERMVAERTQEIESKNAELEKQAETLESKNLALANQSEQLQANAEELTSALFELRTAQDQLMNTSRKAGMAEVATNVLHNVGNVLNSINVAVISLANNIEQHRVEKLVRLSDLIESRQDDLADFFTSDPKGRAVPEYLKRLAHVLQEDFAKYALEVANMHENIDHVKRIIATQQAHAKTIDVFQEIDLPELIDSAIMMIMGDVEHAIFEITRDYDPDLRIVSDKHRILQMMANFIKNGKEAIKEAEPPLGLINIEGRFNEERTIVIIAVRDNGVGIAQDNLNQIFTHGFTTKTDGHGFGMHSSANSAKTLGGSLRIESPGPMKGATVILELPVEPARKEDGERLAKRV